MIRLLVTFILTVENQVQSSLIKILVYSLANCHDLTVNGDGFLVLYIDGPKLISRLPLVMRPVLGLQQQFLWRIMTHLLKDPDRVGDTTVEPPSLSQLHGWPDKVLYF